MYSRYPNRPERPLHIPKDYSGSAFSDCRTDTSSNHFLEVARPSPAVPPMDILPKEKSESPPTEEKEESPLISTVSEASVASPPKKEKAELPAPFQGLFSHLGASLPFANGMEFDQLLILGLILLLLKNEQDNDIVLWLGLLLLCG